jgi:hypothetical protein
MEMVFPPVLYCLVGVGGIQMNAFVVYVTVRSRFYRKNGINYFLI